MVTKAETPYSDRAFSTQSILPRQLSSLVGIVLLYTAATPFNPVSWLFGPVELSGTYLFDRLLAGILLFCAFYFQWRIASLRAAVVVSLPTGGSTTQVRNGRLESVSASSTPLWVYNTSEYWHFFLAEAGGLLVAEFCGNEMVRRFIVGGVIGFLWLVGWAATPASLKKWAWDHIKVYLFFMLLDEVRGVAMRSVGPGGRRRRY
ncbi:hypothetical protein QBC35DRAFT_508985 [Podospora australis]|uniref:Uncharacterized protein n=1 Tax=Podospora australis TaxID=1536484 RepID=A0AAN6WJV0_9PEZI|nr:hypothetical protein QBC35DRAFT_508985 [Podospora australis]